MSRFLLGCRPDHEPAPIRGPIAPDPWSECLHLARELAPAARAAGLLALVQNGALVLRGRGQHRVWTAAPWVPGWRLVWEPAEGRNPSIIAVRDADAAREMLVAALEGLAAERRRVRLVIHLPTMTARKPGEHVWTTHERTGWTVCRVCTVVQRADGRNKPCRGPARLSLRNDPEETTPRPPGCVCTWEEGDSPCPVHGEDE